MHASLSLKAVAYRRARVERFGLSNKYDDQTAKMVL
jgi:hypothetical protein